jgi:hypothetical protein
MPDSLDLVRNRDLRTQLSQIRGLVGLTVPSRELREAIQGFQGQKGIYKPSGSEHALWVRHTTRGVYPDKDVEWSSDGSWTYRYAPEERAGTPVMAIDTNRALMRCKEDGVPIGVFMQALQPGGERIYEVMGLAHVQDFDGRHFILKGEPIDFEQTAQRDETLREFVPFDPAPMRSAERASILRDQRFPWAIRHIYHERCSLCQVGYRVHGSPLALEAAHVIPVADRGTSSDVRNGILLCRNHHALFDAFVWTFDEDYRVHVADDQPFRESAALNHILDWEAKTLPNLPDRPEDKPAPQAIRFRMEKFESSWR